MHAFSFDKQDLKKDSPSATRMSYFFRWVSYMVLYYVDGKEDGYRVPSCYVDQVGTHQDLLEDTKLLFTDDSDNSDYLVPCY
jgi:hypothetical protein